MYVPVKSKLRGSKQYWISIELKKVLFPTFFGKGEVLIKCKALDSSRMKPVKKSLAVTIVLSVIICGLGQIYLGFVKRGIIILIAGYIISILMGLFLPFYLSIPFIVAFWIWQLYDAYKLCNKFFLH